MKKHNGHSNGYVSLQTSAVGWQLMNEVVINVASRAAIKESAGFR